MSSAFYSTPYVMVILLLHTLNDYHHNPMLRHVCCVGVYVSASIFALQHCIVYAHALTLVVAEGVTD
jgi:hypothetical protein